MRPVYEDAEHNCRVCEEGEETFWSIYGVCEDGRRICIGDYDNKDEAAAVVEMLKRK